MKARNTYQKIEILIATLVAGFCIFMLATNHNYSVDRHQFSENHITYEFNRNYLQPSVTIVLVSYLIFLLLTQYVESKTKGAVKIILLVCSYLVLAFTFSFCLSYILAWRYGVDYYQSPRDVMSSFFAEGFGIAAIGFFIYLVYYGLKELIFSVTLRRKLQSIDKTKIRLIVISILAWLLILAMLAANNAGYFAVALWAVVLPYALLVMYIHIFVLIPSLPVKKITSQYYLSRITPIILLINFIAAVFCKAASDGGGILFIGMYILLLVWTIIVIIPLSWWIYNNQKEKLGLQTALGSSQANLSFLRSQINPHFLFNALNTLYGTALQEHAERTGEGIQKLGDMMRFMLHENTKDSIPLNREVEYLQNYISLQRLRVATSPDVNIDTNIEDHISPLQIAPMLLIPFVENAFKHGISLKEPSYIKITMVTRDNILFFDVSNSIHLKPGNDPEKVNSGIGLVNVKERLALLYPERHELVIRESAREYFVHLTINL